MSQRRRAQFGLVSACSILVLTIGVLFVGAKSGLDRQAGGHPEMAARSHMGDVNLAAIHAK